VSDERFEALVKHVGEFHITDKAMSKAQADASAALKNGSLDEAARSRYLDAVRQYFAGFEKEARTHLRDVDRRLEHANQVQFNLTAERGVAVKRIEATQNVLAEIESLEGVTR
jgi:hypothetical protein